ncbi:hypothetical protein FF38_02873 [Lucilia cuprina]|uniref:Uncharacterized protein n=1 Tax=Lucilia cuprina TaxID=7375 RepID=A0A0L0CKZ3_LUCCU|nr:hypothetical protein FF38_02873 [Lucilia cuprina]
MSKKAKNGNDIAAIALTALSHGGHFYPLGRLEMVYHARLHSSMKNSRSNFCTWHAAFGINPRTPTGKSNHWSQIDLRDDRLPLNTDLTIPQHILASHYTNGHNPAGNWPPVVPDYIVLWLDLMPNHCEAKLRINLTSPVYSPGRLEVLVAPIYPGIAVNV